MLTLLIQHGLDILESAPGSIEKCFEQSVLTRLWFTGSKHGSKQTNTGKHDLDFTARPLARGTRQLSSRRTRLRLLHRDCLKKTAD